MRDLGSEIRRYYEEVVERVETDHPVTTPKKRPSWTVGGAVAAAAAIVTVLVFGLLTLVSPSESEPADSVPPPTTFESTDTTEGIPVVLPPSVIVLADGTEIASIREEGPIPSVSSYESLVNYVLRELTINPDYWPTGVDGVEALGLDPHIQTGLTIQLAVDPTVQEIVDSVVSVWHDDSETFISVVVVDNSNGQVLATGSNSGVADDVFDPERRLPAASLAQVYTTIAALESGIALDSIWDASSPQSFSSPFWSGEWIVRNAGSPREPITLYQAVYLAVNTVFAGVGTELGAEPIIDAARRLGVDLTGLGTLTVPQPHPDGGVTPLEAVSIGAGDMSTFEAAAMFTTLSREGVQTTPVLIESITNASGQVIYQATVPIETTVDPDVVEAVRVPLSDVTRIGTATGAFTGFPDINRIGKTASTGSFAVAWYVGSTDQYTAAVAVGRLDGGPLTDIEFDGQMYTRVFGGSVPAPIWVEIITQLIEDK